MSLKWLVRVSCLLMLAGLISLVTRNAQAQPGGYKCDKGTAWDCPSCKDMVALPPWSCRNASALSQIYKCVAELKANCPEDYTVRCYGERWNAACNQGGMDVGTCLFEPSSCWNGA